MSFLDKIKAFTQNPVEMTAAYVASSTGVFLTEGDSIIPLITTLLVAITSFYNAYRKSKIEERKTELDHQYRLESLKYNNYTPNISTDERAL